MNKAIFLDRDGVINKERKDYVKKIEELEIFPEIGKFVKILKDEGFLVIIITNQSVINRNLTTHQDIEKIHNEIQRHLIKYNTKIDDFYYCPHKPDEDCFCRKPNPGMILEAIKDYNIDVKLSWMIGDNEFDVIAAKRAGCNAIKIHEKISLGDAIQQILKTNIKTID